MSQQVEYPDPNTVMNSAIEHDDPAAHPVADRRRDDHEALALRLEATGDYKILRRLTRRPVVTASAMPGEKIAVIVDFETTGLDHTKDEIIEAAMLKLRYTAAGNITGVVGTFEAFNQPTTAIPPEVVELTGITDDMVKGQKFDNAALERFVADANVVIAHNAGFDRKFAERSWEVFQHRAWACSATDVDWRKHGYSGAKLTYLLTECGFFYDAHRALDDCHATLEVLAAPLPIILSTALHALLDCARRTTFRIWAENAPFHLKDLLKRRGYRWNDGTDSRLKSWYIDVDQSQLDAEKDYLRKEIYQRDYRIDHREITAFDRFSNRI